MNYSKIKAIVNCIETDNPKNDYDEITLLHDGPNEQLQITVGVGLTELSSDDLHDLIEHYIISNGKYAKQFQPYLARIGKSPTLATDTNFVNLLKTAAREDQQMRDSQDEIFDQDYFQPAVKWFEKNGFKTNLALLVIYDSYTQSGHIFDFLRNRFAEKVPVNGGDEKAWIKAYVDVRDAWLRSSGNKAVRTSAYRTKGYQQLIAANNWDLTGTIKTLNGCTVTD